MTRKLTFLILALFALIAGPGWAEVVSGTTYETKSTSSLPNGWTGNGEGTSYIQLTSSSNHITTDNFIQDGFTSIVLKARKYGGPSDAQALITVSWYDAATSNETVLGTIAPTDKTLNDYKISSPTNPTGNTRGYIKIQCKGASSGKGSGVSQVTITYTKGGGSQDTYTVTYDANGGQGTMTDLDSPYAADAEVTLLTNTFTREGFTWSSWDVKDASNNTITVEGGKFTMPASNVTVTATWIEKNPATITLMDKGVHYDETNNGFVGDNLLATLTAAGVENPTGLATMPDYEFAGWAQSNSTETPNIVTEETTITGDATLYAIYANVIPGTSTWDLVTSASDLAIGDVVVIAASGYNYAMSTQANNNRTAVEITKDNENHQISWGSETTTVQELTLTAGTVTEPTTFGLYTGSGYLYAPSSSSNQLKTRDENSDGNSSWAITITNNIASIVAQGTNSRKFMQYNPNNDNPIFACYGNSSQTALELYKENTTPGSTIYDFEESAKTLTVTYEANGADGEVPTESQLFAEGDEYTLASGEGLSKTHYTFAGWKANTNEQTYAAGSTYTFGSASVTFTAQWSGNAKYNVAIAELSNGSIVANPTSTYAGETVTLTVAPAADFKLSTLTGANFNEEVASTTLTYTFTMPANNVTISATFEAIPTVSYYYIENGSYSDEMKDLEGTQITLPTGENVNDDFTFAGWTTDPSDVENILTAGSNYPIEASEDEDDVYFYAVYSRTTSLPNSGTTTAEVSIADYATAHGWTNGEKYHTVNIDEHVSVNADQAGNTGAYYTSGNTWRMYQSSGSIWTVDAAEGYSLISAKFTYTSDQNGIISYDSHTYESNAAIDLSGSHSGIFSVVNGKENKGQVRITAISVTYSGGNSETVEYFTRVFQPNDVECEIYGPSIIPSGVTLTTPSLINTNPANLLIENGGQLICNNAVKATVQKTIAGHSGEDATGGWNFIATPIVDGSAVSAVQNGTYDLYRFNQAAEQEWENVKAHSTDFTTLANGQGYLYANAANTTLEFAGTLYNGNGEINLTFADKDNLDNTPYWQGWNLVGNPFTFKAYPSLPYYAMENDGTAISAETSEAAINPCTAVFVKASATGQSVTFSKDAPAKAGSLQISLAQANTKNASRIDNAIVSFGEGQQLEKLYMFGDGSSLYIPQGDKEYSVVSAETEGSLPLCFKTSKNGNYTITVNTENLDAEYLHLIDNMTGMDVDLLTTDSYTFEAKDTDYTSRFKLVFNVKDEASASSANDFAYMSDGNLVISNIEGQATLQIIDMMGRVLSTETVSGNYCKALNLKAGVYVLNLNGMTQKIVVE